MDYKLLYNDIFGASVGGCGDKNRNSLSLQSKKWLELLAHATLSLF